MFDEAYLDGQEVALNEVLNKVLLKEERCPVDVCRFQAKTFFTYLLTFKAKDDLYFSYSCYDGKRSAMMHIFSFADDIWSP